MDKLKNIKDKVSMRDELIVKSNGEALLTMKGNHLTKMIGEITITSGLTGKKLFKFNDIIIPGSTYVLEKMFNTRSTYGMTTLSTDLAINSGVSITQDNLKNEFVFGFVAGIGGTTPPDLINDVSFNEKVVSSIIPIRIVSTSNDLSVADQAKYGMKKTVGGYYYYYAKLFDTTVNISHLYTDGTEIPANVNTLTPTLGMLVFGEATFTVSAEDIREYFMLTYGNIDSCRFNSIGLVAGLVSNGDYAGVRCITKANLPNMYLRDNETYYTFTYRVYCI